MDNWSTGGKNENWKTELCCRPRRAYPHAYWRVDMLAKKIEFGGVLRKLAVFRRSFLQEDDNGAMPPKEDGIFLKIKCNRQPHCSTVMNSAPWFVPYALVSGRECVWRGHNRIYSFHFNSRNAKGLPRCTNKQIQSIRVRSITMSLTYAISFQRISEIFDRIWIRKIVLQKDKDLFSSAKIVRLRNAFEFVQLQTHLLPYARRSVTQQILKIALFSTIACIWNLLRCLIFVLKRLLTMYIVRNIIQMRALFAISYYPLHLPSVVSGIR